MPLGDGPEQFRIVTAVDGKVIRDQLIHDPFLHNTTLIGISKVETSAIIYLTHQTV